MAAAGIPLYHQRSPSPMSTQTTPARSSYLPTPSTAASFKTAPSLSSPAASVHTVTNPPPPAKEYTNISASAADVHVVTLTREDTVEQTLEGFRSRASQDTAMHYGPPPPSPPASVEEPLSELAPSLKLSTDVRPANQSSTEVSPVVVASPSPLPSPSSKSQPLLPFQNQSQTQIQGQTSQTSQPQPPDLAPHPPPSAFLQAERPTRRNTTGSTPSSSRPRRFSSAHNKGHSFAFDDGTASLGMADDSGELASDIEHHADQIRRERMSKRFKQQQKDAEEALTRQISKASKDDASADRPLVGNLIGEDHVNYVLMYNMLTGIRIGVSRCQAKIKRPLTDQDFTAQHKFSFDIVGNELTPSAKYDFKFKDYAPWVFRTLREDHFAIDPADYLLSLTSKYILSELGSPGKSGSFFYFSRDYRFIIKTIRHSEHEFLLSILKRYYEHVKDNPHTLLSRFYGLHRVKLPRGRKIHFVIMNNLFPPHKDIHETFDLKGSTVGREYPEDKAAMNAGAVLKDMNWINRGKMLELGPEKRALLVEQLRRDSEFLKSVSVMDYSLLVGIHSMQRGNRDNVRRNTLKVFSPELPLSQRTKTKSITSKGGTKSPEAIAMRRAMRSSDPKRIGNDSTVQLPEEDSGDKHHFIFYQDEGGLRATDENNEPLAAIYYLGVIDILTPYGVVKKMEHFWKGLKDDRHKISPVPPREYGDRFFSFMRAIMRGGEGGAKFT